MERYFILDKYNTWYDWGLIVTDKDVSSPDPKTNYVNIDGASGSLDLSEALTGEVTYNDRKLSASFWTDQGTRTDRERLLRDIKIALHGRKVKIIEPDDPEHYLIGRISISSEVNNLSYASFTITATCEPWRYAIEESQRTIALSLTAKNIVIYNHGVKTLTPEIELTSGAYLEYDGKVVPLNDGTYRLTDFKLYRGANVVKVSGSTGTITFKYREADL